MQVGMGGGGESWGDSRRHSQATSSIACCQDGAELQAWVGGWWIPPLLLPWEGEINNANKLHERNTFSSQYGFRVSCFSCRGLMDRSEVLPEPTAQMGCGRVYLAVPGGLGIQKPAPAPWD